MTLIKLTLSKFRDNFTGLWLILLYLAFGTLVTFALTAHQLNHSVQTFKVGDKPLTLWQVRGVHSKWNAAKAVLDEIRPQVIANERDLFNSKIAITGIISRTKNNESAYNAVLDDFSLLVKSYGFSVEILNRLKKSNYNLSYLNADTDKNVISKLVVDNEFALLTAKYEKLRKQKDSLPDDLARATARHNELQLENSRIERKIEPAKKNLVEALKIDGKEIDPRIGDFLNGLTYLDAREQSTIKVGYLSWLSLPNFSQMPADMLTLILVLSMGALGGTIHLTQLYFKRYDGDADKDERSGAAYFIFRPFLGAITALAIYILAKAGVFIIATPSAGGVGANLSPFFVSFIGIISGLLAEQALATIHKTGTNWFASSGQTGRERWAFGLANALGTDDTERATKKIDLAKLLGVSPAVIERWLKEEAAVPERYQVTISAFVGKMPREIFSDLKDLSLADEQKAE